MKRVTGLGGLFFKAKDPKAMYEWYEKHLGIEGAPDQGAMFHWRDAADPEKTGMTVWSIFPQATKYFEPSTAPFMMNFRVENLTELLKLLKGEGSTLIRRSKSTNTESSRGLPIRKATALSCGSRRRK